MAGTIWLIIEGQNDADIVKAILRRKYPEVRVLFFLHILISFPGKIDYFI